MVNQNNKRGVTLIVLVFMMLVTVTLIVVAYGFLIIHEMRSSGIALSEESALYIAETGIERAMEYLKNDTDWSNNNGTSIINENFGVGSFSVDFSGGTRTNIVVTSTGTVGEGPNQVQRRIRQSIRRLPEAFNYALFWRRTSNVMVDRGRVYILGGDVFSRCRVASNGTGRIYVYDGGVPSVATGGFVYRPNNKDWTANGAYTEGIWPGDKPPYPQLDRTFYDAEIDEAEKQPSGDREWRNTTLVLSESEPIYVDGEITIDGTTVTGSGALVATEDISIEGSTTITPDSGAFIRIISDRDVIIGDSATTATGTLAYARRRVTLAGVTVRGAFVSPGGVYLRDGVALTGYVYTNVLEMRQDATVNGSVVAVRFTNDRISNSGKVITIRYDHSYLEEAAPGLGLDIDGDANEEGVIIKVPGTWQELEL